jgi:hypothetical protein
MSGVLSDLAQLLGCGLDGVCDLAVVPAHLLNAVRVSPDRVVSGQW